MTCDVGEYPDIQLVREGFKKKKKKKGNFPQGGGGVSDGRFSTKKKKHGLKTLDFA